MKKMIAGSTAVLALWLAVLFVLLRIFYVPSRSMEPYCKAGSFVICRRYPYFFGDPTPDYGTVVVFKCDEKGKLLVKRVVGLAGDMIEFSDGYLVRNGEQIKEAYLPKQGVSECEITFVVPDNSIFVLGDNRRASSDSRKLNNPYIPLEDIIAEVMITIPLPEIR